MGEERGLLFFLTATRVSRPRDSIPAEPLARLPADAHAVINIYFAVTHPPDSRTDLCQERREKKKKCLSHSRNASLYLLGGGTAGATLRLTVCVQTSGTHAVHTGWNQRQAGATCNSVLSLVTFTRRVGGQDPREEREPMCILEDPADWPGRGGGTHAQGGWREPTVQL